MQHSEGSPDAAQPLGYRSVVAGMALAQIVGWAILYYAFSAFVLPMGRDLAWPKTTLMGAYTLGLLVWGVTNYAVGAAIDRGLGRWVMTAGSLLGGVSCALWAVATEPWMLYLALALGGAAMAMSLYEPAFNVLTKRYPTRYRDAITTLTLVAGFASTLSFPASAWLIDALGWRQAMGVLAAVQVFGVAPLHAWLLRGPALVAAPHHADAEDDATLHTALRERTFWLLTVSFTAYAFVSAALWAHVMPAFEAQGLSQSEALWVVVCVGPAQVAGRFVFAWAGRGLSLRRLGIAVTAGLPLSLLIFSASHSLAPMLVFGVMFGLINGLVTIVRGGLVPEYYGRAHIGRIGGAMSAVSLVSRAAAPLATAALLGLLSGYAAAMLVLAVLAAIGAVAFAASRPPRLR